MSECESVRGEWGGICPDCGQRLPSRPTPLASWQSGRALRWRFGTVSDRGWTPEARVSRMAAHRTRGMTDRQQEVLRIVEKHGGNQAAAARELGVSRPTVTVAMKRIGLNA